MANKPDYHKSGNKIGSFVSLLKEGKQKYPTILDCLSEQLVYYDSDMTIAWANRAAAESCGRSPEEFIGKYCYEMWHGRSEICDRCPVVKVFETGQAQKAELILPDARVLSVSCYPVYDESDSLSGVIEVAVDVTAGKKIEAALQKSEEKFRNVIESSPMGIHMYRLEPDGRLIFTGANPSADAILGVENKQFIGKTIEDAFPPLAGTEVPERYRRVCAYGETWQTEQIDYEDDQIKGAFEVYAFQTAPDNMATLFLDITERKRAEEALQVSEKRFRDLAELLPQTVYEMDAQGRLTFVNRRAFEQFLYSQDDFARGLSAFDMLVAEDRFRAMDRTQRIMRGEQIGLSEYTALRKDGSTFPAMMHSAVIYRDGNPVGLRGIIIDISEKKRLEVQLQQAQKMESLGTLAGGIAHDFNNLLMGIQGRASLVLADINAMHPHFEDLKEIQKYVRRATQLTTQLLGLARGGKYEVKPTDLNDLLRTSSQMFARTKKEITIHRKFQKGLWTVVVDRSQLDQVFLNIYVNAWQAMPGGGNLYLQTENVILNKDYVKPYRIEPGKYVKVSITDTGIGMNKNTLKRVFDPFFTTKEKERGTGLGLAAAYGIISNHNGIITAYSEKGHGAAFSIYLPASEQAIVDEPEFETNIVQGDETILLVDDEQIILDVGRQMLEKMGYTVLTADSGAAAINVFKRKKDSIKLVILDMIMPNMNGGETYDRLMQINPGLKVLLSSGYSLNGQASDIINRGCNGFIQKPFDLMDLSQKTRFILDG